MKKHRPILQILADHSGVYEISIRAPGDAYGQAERLSAALKPAIDIIDKAIREAQVQLTDKTVDTE